MTADHFYCLLNQRALTCSHVRRLLPHQRRELAEAMFLAGVENDAEFEIALDAWRENAKQKSSQLRDEKVEELVKWLQETQPYGVQVQRYPEFASRLAKLDLKSDVGRQFALAEMVEQSGNWNSA